MCTDVTPQSAGYYYSTEQHGMARHIPGPLFSGTALLKSCRNSCMHTCIV